MSQYASNRIAAILDRIQELHAEARRIASDFNIPFEITLDGGQLVDTTAEFEPSGYENSDSWYSSSC